MTDQWRRVAQDVWRQRGYPKRRRKRRPFGWLNVDEQERFDTICALVDASIGYFMPSHAALVVERFERGETECWAERCIACFGGDLRRMVESDRRFWAGLREERREGVRDFVRQAMELDGQRQGTLSLMFPTMGL